MGRPTKIEGNPDHPASLGATDAITQAAVLGLYDPDRAQTTTFRTEVTAWNTFLSAMQSALAAQKATQGEGIRFLTEPITSPSLAELMASVLQDFPRARWHQYDPMSRSGVAATADAEPVYQFDKADVVLGLDADFLCCGPGALRYTRDFTNRRRVTDDNKSMNRLYAVESTPTLTGAKADHRLPLKASEIEPFARALAGAAGVTASGTAEAGRAWTADEQKWIAAVAKDLGAHRGRSVVVAGEYQPPAVHALARSLNEALGNVGTTVRYVPAVYTRPTDQTASIADLARAMDAGDVQLLVIMGINPVFTAPSNLRFAEKLAKVGLAVYHGLYTDETANLCHWNIAATHPLETWGDPRAYDGTVTIMQPLVAPLYEGRSEHELICAFTQQPGRRTGDLVKEYWTRAFSGQSGWTIRTSDGQTFPSADAFWRRVGPRWLHPWYRADRWRAGHAVQTWSTAQRSGCRDAGPGRRSAAGCCRSTAAGRAPGDATAAAVGAVDSRGLLRKPGDHLPTRSDRLGRQVRQQRLASGTAETADQTDVGYGRVDQPPACGAARPQEWRCRRTALPGQRRRHAGDDRAGPAGEFGHGLLRLRPQYGWPGWKRERGVRTIQRVPPAHV